MTADEYRAHIAIEIVGVQDALKKVLKEGSGLQYWENVEDLDNLLRDIQNMYNTLEFWVES